MFRYLAIAWDAARADCNATAEHLGQRWLTYSDWTPSLLRPGLQVFTVGARAGINEATTLPGGQGLVLGKVFRKADLSPTSTTSAPITSKEGATVLATHGQSLVESFWGRYVTFMQTESGSVIVLRDPTGTLPCFLMRHEGVTLVFSWLEDALQLLGQTAPTRVNWDALLTQIHQGSLTGRETCLEGVSHVLPGERLDLLDDASTLLWNPVAIARDHVSAEVDDAVRSLKIHVQSCTRAWTSCYGTALLRLSGGVDSSILLSCLAPKDIATDVIGINYHSIGSDTDERTYARLAAARVGRDLIERERDGGFKIDRVQRIARMPEPVRYTGWMNAASDAALAKAYGAPAMLTGAGGDSLFYEYPRWWPAADYLHVRGLGLGFGSAAMDAAHLGKTSFWRTAQLALQERYRRSSRVRAPTSHMALLVPARPSCNPHRFDHPALQGADALPIGKHTQTLALMQPLGYYDPFEQSNAPEIVNPLFSQPLVELSLRWPTFLLAHGGRGRALARRAFADELPKQIVNRRSKGGMEEHLRAVLLTNIELVRGCLLEGQLAARGIIDRVVVETLLSGRPTALAAHNSQIHALVATELWLARWAL